MEEKKNARMNKAQKKYKIKKIETYCSELYNLNQEKKFLAYGFGMSTIASLISFSLSEKVDIAEPLYWALMGIGSIDIGIAGAHFVKLISVIQKKTVLEFKIGKIQDELKMDELAYKPKASDLREIDEEIQFRR
jgi:hypothetical protein